MSEKFGLDWKNYDNDRMLDFMAIMVIDSEKQPKKTSNFR